MSDATEKKDAPVTVDDFLEFAKKSFAESGIETPSLDASVLISDALGVEKTSLYSHGEKIISDEMRAILHAKIDERIRRRPISQITGKKEFYGRNFFVNEDVLAPRPETEGMIDLLLNENLPVNAEILDLCSGSGCVGITLLLERPHWKCHFTDISEKAMKVLKKNGESLVPDFNKRSQIFIGDFFKPLPDVRYDAILTNPPYIHPDEKKDLQPEIFYEPEGALFSENLPGLYFQIIDQSKRFLQKNGILICELSSLWASDVLKHGETRGFSGRIVRDLGGFERFVFFKKNE